MNDSLFDATPYEVPSSVPADALLSPDQRRTMRQAKAVLDGRHPLRGGPLHPDAPEGIDRTRRAEPFTCGTCEFRVVFGHNDKTYPKCTLGKGEITNGAATDVRAWWPACTGYQGVELA